MCGMSGSGAYLTFLLWFAAATAPFLLLSVVPGYRHAAVHQIRTLEEECCLRWESIFPSAHGENSSAFQEATALDGTLLSAGRKIADHVIAAWTFLEDYE